MEEGGNTVNLEMQYLGATDLQISTVGFGAWAIGGEWAHGWGPQDDAISIAARGSLTKGRLRTQR